MFSALAAPSAALTALVSASLSPQISTPWPDKAYRAAQRSAKHQAVLATAARLFCERGFHAAALDDVAARLQVSKPTLYYYVRSKKALIEACAQQGLENALQALQACSVGGRGGNRLKACLAAYAQSVATDFGWCMVRSYELAQTSVALQQELAQQLAAACPEMRDADEALMWLLAVDGIACTGGRRSAEEVKFHVERLLARLGSSMTMNVSLPEQLSASSAELLELPVAEINFSSCESIEVGQIDCPHVNVSPGELLTAAPQALEPLREKSSHALSVTASATTVSEPVEKPVLRKSKPNQLLQKSGQGAAPRTAPSKTAQFSLF